MSDYEGDRQQFPKHYWIEWRCTTPIYPPNYILILEAVIFSVNIPSSATRKEHSQAGELCGTYSPSSSSYAYVNNYFNVSYADGSQANGIYATDNHTIGDSTMNQVRFGIGETSSLTYGIMGIGFKVQVRQPASYAVQERCYPIE